MLEPTERQYHIKCKVLIKKIQVDDPGVQDQLFERTVCYLIPEKNDQGISFMNAWLPETSEETFEIATIIKPPIDSTCRVAISRRNKNCDEHHLFVMSKGVEDDFIRLNMDGKTVQVKVLSESEEEISESGRDSDGSYDIV